MRKSRNKELKERQESLKRLKNGIKDAQIDSLRKRRRISKTKACTLYILRNEVFNKLDGFDVDFFAHQEEIDLCWRAHNLDYKIKYNGKSKVYHVGGATLKTGSPQKTFLNFRNSLWMMTKNLPKKKLFSRIFMRMVLDGIAGIKFLIEGKPKHLWAVLKSHFYFYFYFSKFIRKRSYKQFPKYYKTNSIVYLYFAKNKRKYSEIF